MKRIITLIIVATIILIFSRSGEQQVSAAPSFKYARDGQASWYSRRDRGINKRTASNEIFDDQDMTCAMWGVQFNRMVKVTNRANGKSVVLRVNDRGPHQRFIRQGRIIDLTKGAFERLSTSRKGLIDVTVEFL